MKTDDLIAALAADLPAREPPTRRLLLGWGAAAFVAAVFVLLATLGVRKDVAAALETVRFPFKFVVTVALAAAAFPLVLSLARPVSAGRRALLPLLLPAGVIAAGCILELVALPPEAWSAAARGVYGRYCLVCVPLLSLLPLAAGLVVLKRAAPASPTLAGAAAGLFAAGLGATVYAAHCTDDSPLFLALWYGTATAIVTALGALAGRRWLRW